MSEDIRKMVKNFKQFVNENYTDKYVDYKKKWFKNNQIVDLEINKPFSFNIYLFPNQNGFLVELFNDNNLIGQFHSFLDEDEGFLNDIEISKPFQKKGIGKILTLLAIEVGNNYLDGFSTDSRGVNPNQWKIYQYLLSEKIISSDFRINYEKAQEEINKIISKFIF